MFLLVQSADHLSALTGATPTVNVSKAGGAFAAAGGTVTEVANGFYKIALTTTDTNTLGDLAYHITATSGDPTDFTDQVVAVDVGDATAFGLSRIDAAISSRMATFTLPTNFSSLAIDASGRVTVGSIVNGAIAAATFAANALGAVWDELRSGHTTANTFGAGTIVATNNDKTGYALSAAGVQAIWDALTSALTTAGSIGLRLVTDIDATISSRNSTTPPTAAAISTQVWSEPIPGSFAAGSAGVKLNSASAAGDPWGTAVPGAYAAGTAGNILGNRLDVAVSTRATSAGAGGAGAISVTYTVHKPDGTTPLQDCEVWVSTDLAGNNVVAGTLNTNASGQVTFKLDAGTYYFWRHHSAYRFNDPDTEVVS